MEADIADDDGDDIRNVGVDICVSPGDEIAVAADVAIGDDNNDSDDDDVVIVAVKATDDADVVAAVAAAAVALLAIHNN